MPPHSPLQRIATAIVLAIGLSTPILSHAADNGWVTLFADGTFDGWKTIQGRPATDGWVVSKGGLELRDPSKTGGGLISEAIYRDFEFSFEWNIAAGMNNGIKYRVAPDGPLSIGCEYQILGETKPSFTKNSTASLYDVYETNKDKAPKPPGEWNHGRIVVRGNILEHWLNGKLVMRAEAGSDEWKARIAKSKFRNQKNFGVIREGRILFTSHGDPVKFRNLKIRRLD